VLGSLLWSIAYNYILRLRGIPGTQGYSLVGYTDDILILCFGKTVEIVQSQLNTFIAYVVRRIEFLSLNVAADKTEVVLFRDRRRLDYTNSMVRIGRSLVPVQPSMKYLGVMLDSKLTFKHHFSYIDGKVGRVTRALGHLMPNLRVPHKKKRRLYAGIIISVVMYVAPIWAPSLATAADSRRLFRRWQRTIVVRVCVAYRLVSFDSATLLARLVPYELLAMERARIFRRVQDAKDAGGGGYV